MDEIFSFYDLDAKNKINYREFTSIIFGTSTGMTRKMSPKKVQAVRLGEAGGDEVLLEAVEALRAKLAQRGGFGMIGLYN